MTTDPDDAEVLAPRPEELGPPLRHPIALVGIGLAGFAMGVAEVVPGFSGGTVALVCGIYARLVANVRQGARTLSLLLRGRFTAAVRAFVAIEWPFVITLVVGMAAAIVTLAGALSRLIEEQPVAMSAVFLGLVLGAVVAASSQLITPRAGHFLVGVVVAGVTFVGLGASAGSVDEPALWLLFAGVAVAVCAWILPGVSGAFLLLLLGLYPAALAAVADRDLAVLGVMVLGALTGLALFSTLLNWLLVRWHDLVLVAMLGLLVGSARVFWPWPSADGMGDPALGAPEPGTVPVVVALTLGAFALVWAFALVADRLGAQGGSRPGSATPER